MHVLIVEPDSEVRESLVKCLTAGHHEVTSTGSGPEALQKLEENIRPALVLIDLDPSQMPVLDLLAAIRVHANGHIPALFVSRTPRPSRRFGALGPVIAPPFEPARVLAAVDQALLEASS